MNFEFATATRILFGAGTAGQVPALAAGMGRRILVLSGGKTERAESLLTGLRAHRLLTNVFRIPEEPTVERVLEGAALAKSMGCDAVVAMGGGSVIDAGKALAAVIANDGNLFDYLEVIGRGREIERPPVPFIAVPTTAGTGAEVTRNAVLTSPEHQVKVSMRSAKMLPKMAVVDPELTHSLPPAVTAFTGMDALTQLLEAFVSPHANPLTDGICREGLARAGKALRRAYQNGADAAAREDMCLASLFGGLALANAKLGAVHGLAAPLGGMFNAHHGAVCAALLPHVMAVNIRRLKAASEAANRYTETARILCGDASATAEAGADWVAELVRDLKIPPLRELGIQREGFPELAEKARKASSMKGNPVPLTGGELREILEQAF